MRRQCVVSNMAVKDRSRCGETSKGCALAILLMCSVFQRQRRPAVRVTTFAPRFGVPDCRLKRQSGVKSTKCASLVAPTPRVVLLNINNQAALPTARPFNDFVAG